MSTPIIIPTIVSRSNGRFNGTGSELFLTISVLLIVILFVMYLFDFFLMNRSEEAGNKKEFLMQFIIPFYWWIKDAKEWILEAIDKYKRM